MNANPSHCWIRTEDSSLPRRCSAWPREERMERMIDDVAMNFMFSMLLWQKLEIQGTRVAKFEVVGPDGKRCTTNHF
jgi:hypothetical protein